MGGWGDFTSWMSGAMKTVGGAISHAATGVANFASATLDKIIGGGEHIADQVAKTYQTGMQAAATTVGGLGNNVKDLGSSLGNSAGNAIDGLGKSLSMPLAIGAAGVVIFMLMNNKPK